MIEPKPAEPTKHQYDFDTATVYGFLKRYGLEKEVAVNIEQNHALLAGHTFEHEIVTARYPDLGARRLVHEVVRRMIDYLVNDLIGASSASIDRISPASVEDVRAQSEPLLTFSDEVHAEHLELKRYLREHLYRHYRVLRMTTKAKRVVRELFGAMLEVVAPDAARSAIAEIGVELTSIYGSG